MDLAERLQAAGFTTAAAQNPRYRLACRGATLCLIDTRVNQAGSLMRMTASGLASLLWRGETAIFVGRGFELAVSEEELAELRAFEADLNKALHSES